MSRMPRVGVGVGVGVGGGVGVGVLCKRATTAWKDETLSATADSTLDHPTPAVPDPNVAVGGDSVFCPECGTVLHALPSSDVELWKGEATKLLRSLSALRNRDTNAIEAASRMPDAKKVWDYWLATFKKNPSKWKFGKSRKEGILKALGDYTVDDLCEAIQGCKLSVWHVENGRIDIETIFKDAKSIDNHRARLHAKGWAVVDGELVTG